MMHSAAKFKGYPSRVIFKYEWWDNITYSVYLLQRTFSEIVPEADLNFKVKFQKLNTSREKGRKYRTVM